MRYTNEPVDDHSRWNRDLEEARDSLAQAHAEAQMQSKQAAQGYSITGQMGMGPAVGIAPKRPPAALPLAVNELNHLAASLMNVLMDLEKRLEPIMRSVPPATNAKQPEEYGGSTTQLGSCIVQASHTIDMAINRVRDLLDRLEI